MPPTARPAMSAMTHHTPGVGQASRKKARTGGATTPRTAIVPMRATSPSRQLVNGLAVSVSSHSPQVMRTRVVAVVTWARGAWVSVNQR